MRNYPSERVDKYVPTYCAVCAQLQWRRRIGKACEFCGSTTFMASRPAPMLTRIDRRVAKQRFEIPPKDK
jgi:hypothetical protein